MIFLGQTQLERSPHPGTSVSGFRRSAPVKTTLAFLGKRKLRHLEPMRPAEQLRDHVLATSREAADMLLLFPQNAD